MIVGWLPRAVEQLLSIIDHVSGECPAGAVRPGESIRGKTTMFATYPNRYRTGRVRGTREMVAMSDYIVVYRVAGERVQILRVRHAR